ncbi:MAG: hypothetical protein IH863_01300 [Chloroflexi bacterium]|nr:hypothetical protein [Chloroflexota bacterium]
MRNVLVSVASAAFIAVGIAWVATQPADAATEEIDAGNLYFCDPSFTNGVCTTTITVGDTVTWKSVFGFHTVTECDATYTTCPVVGGFDSGVLDSANDETFSQTFDAVGDVAYFCAIHPIEMRGVISVVAAPTDTPAPTETLAETPDATGAVSPTMSPAAVPTSGGEPPTGGLPLQALVLALGGALAVAGAAALCSARRR